MRNEDIYLEYKKMVPNNFSPFPKNSFKSPNGKNLMTIRNKDGELLYRVADDKTKTKYDPNKLDISKRCELWSQKKAQKIKDLKIKRNSIEIEECTFKPLRITGCSELSIIYENGSNKKLSRMKPNIKMTVDN